MLSGLGLSTAANYGRLETEEMAALMPGMGLDCCEVFLDSYSEFSTGFAQIVKDVLQGLPVHSVHALGTVFEAQLFSHAKRQREDARDILLRILDAAALLGAKVYVYHGPFRVNPQFPRTTLERIVPVVTQMMAAAAERDMVIGWENVSWAWLNTPEDAAKLRQAMPDLHFVLDNKQAHHRGLTLPEFLPAVGPQLANVHLCDIDTQGQLCLAGRGSVDFTALFRTFFAHGYHGPFIYEPYSHLFETQEELQGAVDYLRASLRKASQNDENAV